MHVFIFNKLILGSHLPGAIMAEKCPSVQTKPTLLAFIMSAPD